MTIAIDVLLEPDDRIHELALKYNRGFLLHVPPPDGVELGPDRLPHVTVVQRYVRAEALDDTLRAVESVVRTADRAVFDLVATGDPWGGRPDRNGTTTVIWPMVTTPQLLELQSDLLAALEPFAVVGGDGRAFARGDDEPPISASTIRYVERFVPDHSGAAYSPHLTLGRARVQDVAALEGQVAEPIPFTSPALAAYQLGDHGTARRQLARWPR